ncbi:hypothetical protein OIU76_009751 [Salix suchowensis]|uniref:Uncharacterized protein n=1 Tax=Salix suchowensis TaxID=1278906 RepID=A0ABQ9BDV9_9ROSI|nr:hypothetical protein OIU76_009751 [Salix suchowensis]KAJ6362582.1 hypothetical protein OIU78_002893 [Salix suchowensis]KAJ6381747.1 hypothetical protein OIU77_030423 [Salix suchowensis]
MDEQPFPLDPHRRCSVACRETLMQNIVGFEDTTLKKKKKKKKKKMMEKKKNTSNWRMGIQQNNSKIDACSCLIDVPSAEGLYSIVDSLN